MSHSLREASRGRKTAATGPIRFSRPDAKGKLCSTRTPYSTRHFFVSEAIAAGIPSYEVARVAGTSVTQIEATYARLFGEHLERSRVTLEVSTPVVLRRLGANRARTTDHLHRLEQ